MNKNNLWLVGFLQATGLAVYCGLVSILIWNGNHLFGRITDFRGPLLFLILFVASALISGILTLGYPFVLWQRKDSDNALKLVFYTAGFLVLYAVLAVVLLMIRF